MGKRLRSRILEHLKKYYYESHRGTHAYIDPKCFNDIDSRRDEKSDVFSYGIILWEISSRKYPCSEFKTNMDIQVYRLKGGRHDAVPGTPKEYKSLYTECWDSDPEKRPTSEECYHRLRNIMGNLNQLPEWDTNQDEEKIIDHTLSDELFMLYNKLQFKGKSIEQITDYIKNWLIENNDSKNIH